MVKFIGFAMLVLLSLTAVFFAGFIISDFETNYIDRNISQASPSNFTLDEEFEDDLASFNRSVSGLAGFILEDQEQDPDIISAIFQGAILFVSAIVQFPFLVIDILGVALNMSSSLFVDILAIPPAIIIIAVVGLSTFVIFKIIEYARRFEA